MGILRLLLALAVVVQHGAGSAILGYRPVGGQGAVQSFYVVSGFYMSLVLSSKYGPGKTLLFYQNRLLRLLPTYLVVLALSAAEFAALGSTVNLTTTELAAQLPGLGLGAKALLVVTNLGVLGQDAVMFLAVDPLTGALYFTPHFASEALPAYRFLLVPQAWTLGVELLFYLGAPFLVRRSARAVGLVMAASLALRLGLAAHGWSRDPWSYRFFPSELFFFLAGNLAFRAHGRIQRWPSAPRLGKLGLGAVVAVILGFDHLPLPMMARHALFYGLFAVALPFVFELTRTVRWDGRLGELSYPIYLGHLLLLPFCGWAGGLGGLVLCGASTAFAWVLVKGVERPIDVYRQRRAREPALEG